MSLIPETTKVTHTVLSDIPAIEALFSTLDSTYTTIACDFEAASCFTDVDRAAMKTELESIDPDFDFDRYCELRSMLASSALTYPKYITITHLSIAWSETESAVIIMKNDAIRKLCLDWLTTTKLKQIWHNFSYDGRLIHYFTGKLPVDYEDSQQYAKCILNHVETWKANTSLKELAGTRYGDWGISSDNFTLENIHDPHLLKYAAIDSCATYWLWNSMHTYVKENT